MGFQAMRLERLQDAFLHKRLAEQNTLLAGSLAQCWEEASKLLRHTAGTHPTYTSHGPDHALALVHILDKAIEPIRAEVTLTPPELYILLAAALLHDVGMVGDVAATEAQRAQFRRDHHVRTYSYICSHWRELHLEAECYQVIADVAAAHRKQNIIQDIHEFPVGVEGSVPRAKLCAALLRLVDECHITADRVPQDYGSLGLPLDSASHFEAHVRTHGLTFDPKEGVVRLAVTVETEADEQMFGTIRDKIKAELSDLQPVFAEHRIPYADIVLDERRDALTRRRAIRSLLRDGPSSVDELVASCGEAEQSLRRFMRRFGESAPFDKPSRTGAEVFRLAHGEKVFDELAEEFLARPDDHEDPLVFIRSDFCQRFLTDEFVGSLFEDAPIGPEDPPVLLPILRSSPSALKYVLQNRERLGHRNMVSGGGLVHSLMGEVEKDFDSFPDLLLTPGLLDDVFAGGTRDHSAWERWKILQVSEYHKAFDDDAVMRQWAVPDEWERKGAPELGDPKWGLRFTVSASKDRFRNPMLLLAAANRLGMELRLQSGGDIVFRVDSVDGLFGGLAPGAELAMMSFKRPSRPDEFLGYRPCSFRRLGPDKYLLDIDWAEPLPAPGEWQAPIGVHFHVKESDVAGSDRVKEFNWNLSFTFHPDLMDCGQVATMLDAARNPNVELFITNPPSSTEDPIRQVSADECMRNSLGRGLDDEGAAFVRALARIQRNTGASIPFPAFGWPAKAAEVIIDCQSDSRQEAEAALARLRHLASAERPVVSPVIVEILVGERVLERRLVDHYPGTHQPRMSFTFKAARIEDPLAALQQAMDDASKEVKVQVASRLSPRAAVEFIRANPVRIGDRDRIHPGVLHQMAQRSMAECRTKVEYRWEPVKNHFWYDITHFRCVLSPFANHERWIMESQHFADEGDDSRRAYLAAREANRCRPDLCGTCIDLGWHAFIGDRIDEALRVTADGSKKGDDLQKYKCAINTGLTYLRKAALHGTTRDASLQEAAKSYGQAGELLGKLGREQALLGIQEAIADLQRFRERLDPDAGDHLRRLAELRTRLASGEVEPSS